MFSGGLELCSSDSRWTRANAGRFGISDAFLRPLASSKAATPSEPNLALSGKIRSAGCLPLSRDFVHQDISSAPSPWSQKSPAGGSSVVYLKRGGISVTFTLSIMASTAATNEQGDQTKGGAGKGSSGGSSPFSYFGDSINELKKVTFPTRAETRQATIVTIFIVMFVSFCLFLLDQVFFRLMTAVLG